VVDHTIRDIIYAAIDGINEDRDENEFLPKSLDVVLAGESALLNSLQIVTLIAEVEEGVEENYCESLSLLEGMTELLGQHPSVTVSILLTHIAVLLEKSEYA
jgi:hypothetical protein